MNKKTTYLSPKILISNIAMEDAIAVASVRYRPFSENEMLIKEAELFQSNGDFEIDWNVPIDNI